MLHHGNGAFVVAAIGQDEVGMLFGGFDKFIVHGFEHIAILIDQHLEIVSALCDVALNDAE